MRYRVLLLRSSERERRKLPSKIRKRVNQALLNLEVDPRPPGCTKLKGYRNRWRIRIGDYRVIYRVKDNEIEVLVLKIAHRREVYR